MRAAQLNKRVKFLQRQTGVGEFGQPLQGYLAVLDAWAEIEPLSANQRYAAQQLQLTVTHKVTVRYRELLSTAEKLSTMRLQYKQQQFTLYGPIRHDEREKMLELYATEGVIHGN